MHKEQQAVIQGLIITALVVVFLTFLWAVYVHFFPNTWGWLKTSVSLINYSLGLYLGMLSASLRVKSIGISAALYVMLIFFVINIFLRLIFIGTDINYSLVVIKFTYSGFLLMVAFRQAKALQNKKASYTYGRLR